MSIVKEEKTFFQLSSYLATCIIQHWSGRSQDYQEPEILNKTGLFLSLWSVIFGFLTPKKLPHIKFQDERMTRTILITENVNSKWQILPRQNIHFKFSNLNNFRTVRSWGLKFSGIDHGLSTKILFIETITNIEKRNKIWEVRLRRVSSRPGWLLVDGQTQYHPWV